MANKDDNTVEVEEYTTSTEVNGIRRTLDQFMKKQDQFNVKMASTMDQLMELMMRTSVSTDSPLHENKGSSAKGNLIKPSDPQFVPKPSMPNIQLRKSQFGAPSGIEHHKHDYTPPPKLRAIAQGNFNNHDTHVGDHQNPVQQRDSIIH